MSNEQIKLARHWYVTRGYDLITIAQHFGLHVEQLKKEIRT